MTDSSAAPPAMPAVLGPYAGAREASGTSWQPDSSPLPGRMHMRGPWMLMLHGAGVLDVAKEGGPRGDRKVYSTSMIMAMGSRPVGRSVTLGARAMLSLEPATVGRRGYPILLQTGETADGRTPLIDRQHPHDLFMELAFLASVSGRDRSLFIYAAPVGEPALGPPAFMHRGSAEANPEPPITHHWLDSTHITSGVLTAGVVRGDVKVEGSVFHGREPDQDRTDLEPIRFDSWSGRLSLNPSVNWSVQGSYGRIESPEQLHPEVDVRRATASVIFHRHFRKLDSANLVAWGRNQEIPGHRLDAILLESSLGIGLLHTVFVRAERAQKDGLFPEPDPRTDQVFRVHRLSGGYRYDFVSRPGFTLGVGLVGALVIVPAALDDAYGRDPWGGAAFLHGTLR